MEKSLFSLFLSNFFSIRNIVILLGVFFYSPLLATDNISDQIVVSGGAEIITANPTEKKTDSVSENTSSKPIEYKKVRNYKKKMISTEAIAAKQIPSPVSDQSLKKIPV